MIVVNDEARVLRGRRGMSLRRRARLRRRCGSVVVERAVIQRVAGSERLVFERSRAARGRPGDVDAPQTAPAAGRRYVPIGRRLYDDEPLRNVLWGRQPVRAALHEPEIRRACVGDLQAAPGRLLDAVGWDRLLVGLQHTAVHQRPLSRAGAALVTHYLMRCNRDATPKHAMWPLSSAT